MIAELTGGYGYGRAPAEIDFTSDASMDRMMLAFGAFFALVCVFMVVAGVRGAGRERRRLAQLDAHAAANGWTPVPPGAALPGPVAEAAGSRRSKLVLTCRREDADLWLIWHRWTETTGGGETATSHTRHLTRYFLFSGHPLPDVQVVRRSRIGAALMPVRGPGTGDSEFDREFLIRTDAGPAALALFTPQLRQAMVGGALPPWEIKDGLLVTAYKDRPDASNLQLRADAAVRVARLVP